MERRFFYFVLLVITSQFFIQSVAISQGDSLEIERLRQDSIEIERLSEQGKQEFRAGNFKAAELSFDSIFFIDSASIKARNNLGLLYKNLGRYNDALRVYFEGDSIVRKKSGPDHPDLADLYSNIGNVYNLMQDYDLALQYFNYANKIYTDIGEKEYPAHTVPSNMGNAYYGMQEYRTALQYYKIAIEAKISTDRRLLDVAYANCAIIYEDLGELDSASLYVNYSIQEKKANYGEESFRLIPTYVNYGELLLKMDNLDDAFDYFTMALELVENRYDNKHPDLADCQRALANWYLEAGEVDQALEYHQKGLTSVVFDFNNADIYVNPGLDNEIMSEPVLLQILHDKALALEKKNIQSGEKNDLAAMLETLEIANSLAEKMRSSYLSEGSKLIITGLARTGFERTIQAAYNLYKLTGDASYSNKAFISAEKSKSSVLLASLQEVERKKNLAIPAEMQEQERNIKKETEILKRKLLEESQQPEPDQYKLDKWQEQLFYLSQQLDSIDNVIRERFPEYAAKYDNEVIGLDGIRAKLADDEVLLEYSMSDTSLYIFMVNRDEFRIERFSIDSSFHDAVAVLSLFLRNNDFSRGTYDDYQAYVNAANDLYSIFIEPMEAYIEGKKLLIIPDGDMGYIPFEALLTEKPENGRMDYRSLPYLLYKYRTNYSYSATLYFSEDTDRQKAGKTLLAFAPTYENIGEISSDKFPTYRDYSTYLVPLRFISTEIRNISEIIDADKFEAFDATEKVFKEKAPDYNILHLAMHTLLNDENPLYSKLVFTMNNDTVEENDGLLHAYEIFNMQLNAQMAVLSACNTGYGKLQRGEGIMSMARGFIFAGVPSIIMTLWAVEDQSGSILMSKFYSNLVEGMEIDEALQEAKLQYLMEADQLGAHPYLWSGYVSIGSTDALITSSWSNVFIISGTALVIILLIVFIIFWVSSRKRA